MFATELLEPRERQFLVDSMGIARGAAEIAVTDSACPIRLQVLDIFRTKTSG